MELIINCYLNYKNYNNFLLPNYFFINEDNSYFYVIEKYNTDLHKYFNILESNHKTLSFKNILYITKFIIDSISILHRNNIIHSDFKLENIVLNIDDEYNIKDLKIIDFDVGLFNIIPEYLNNVSEKYQKILQNKKSRGTRIYMIKDTEMCFKNDIFSLGVISLILMYKNMKLFLAYSKKLENKKLIKKLSNFRNNIEDNKVKIELLDLIENIVDKNCVKKITKQKRSYNKPENFVFFDENNDINKYKLYQEFITDCIECKCNIEELKEKYNELF
jgi:serine/threonine protein kinase